jgi:hypothetical protein
VRLRALLRQRNLQAEAKESLSVALLLLRRVNPAGLRAAQSKANIEAAGLSKLEILRLQVQLRLRRKVENKKGKALTRNPALRQGPVQLHTRARVEERGDKAPTRNPAQRLLAAGLPARPEAENKKARELMGNLVVRPAADLLLRPVPSKANQSAERKRARKFLRLRPALNNTHLLD